MSFRITFTIFILLRFLSFAQSDSLQVHTEQIIEDIFEEPVEETDLSDLYEEIEYYISNPVNLNKVSVNDLNALPYLDLTSAQLIIEHRSKYGKFFSSNELYSVTGLPDELVNKILPFLSVKNSSSNKTLIEKDMGNISLNMRNRILLDIQNRKGFSDNIFLGSPLKMYNRINIEYSDNFRAGILTDKDAGEKLYYDFYSGYLNIYQWHNFNNIIIGDYINEFGHGLALSGPYGRSKGSDAIYPVKRKSGCIKPYKSSTETNFFRGVAADYQWEHVNISGFYSHNFIDANIDSVTGTITSTPLDGLHRTNNELYKRKSIIETSYGISLNYNKSTPMAIGILYYTSRINHPYQPLKIYDIEGSIFNYYSGYIDLFLNDINIFGEYSYDGSSIASISGLQISPSPRFNYVLLIRSYLRNYTNLHGTGFGKRSGALQNEFGIYNGLKWSTIFGTFNFYYDQFKYPYATYENPLPSNGYDIMLHFSSGISRGITIITKMKIVNKETTEIIDLQKCLVRGLKQSYRFDFIYTLSRNVRLKTRFEYTKYFVKNTSLSEEGYVFFEDARIEPFPELLLYLRAVFFQTSSYNSVIYEFENDLAGIMNNIALYGKGVRLYAVLRYKFMSKLSLSFKYSETYKPMESSIGTGYLQIEGNLDNRVGLQIDFTF